MNVFACHPDPAVAASWLADQHVVKMVTESAQILSAALRLQGHSGEGLFKLSHKNHPCVKTAVQDQGYFIWTARHGLALADEYTKRYGKTHASEAVLRAAIETSGVDLTSKMVPVEWPLAMPEEFRQVDPHAAYKACLIAKYDEWRSRGKRVAPRWKRVAKNNPFVQKD